MRKGESSGNYPSFIYRHCLGSALNGGLTTFYLFRGITVKFGLGLGIQVGSDKLHVPNLIQECELQQSGENVARLNIASSLHHFCKTLVDDKGV